MLVVVAFCLRFRSLRVDFLAFLASSACTGSESVPSSKSSSELSGTIAADLAGFRRFAPRLIGLLGSPAARSSSSLIREPSVRVDVGDNVRAGDCAPSVLVSSRFTRACTVTLLRAELRFARLAGFGAAAS